MKNILAAFVALCFLVGLRSPAQEKVKEPSTGKMFPTEVSFTYSGKDYNLKMTGMAVRKKLVFKVYGIAHYMQDFAKAEKENAFTAVLTDGKAKQITMDFARDVDTAKIKEAYADGFKEHATAEELRTIQPLIRQFLGYFSKDVKENDQYILRWVPGGTILTTIAGEEKSPITNVTFARTLWSIWLGKDSIVDREDLMRKGIAD